MKRKAAISGLIALIFFGCNFMKQKETQSNRKCPKIPDIFKSNTKCLKVPEKTGIFYLVNIFKILKP